MLTSASYLKSDLPHHNSSPEPVSLIDTKRTSFRPSGLKNLISNPRLSTFRQLPSVLTGPCGNFMALSRRLSGSPGQKSATSDNLSQGKHVTVQFDKGTPKLHLHLSDLDITSLVQWDPYNLPSLHADPDSGDSFSQEKGEIRTVPRATMSRAPLVQSVAHSTPEHDVRLSGGPQKKEPKGKGKGVMDGEKNAQFLKSLSRGSIPVDKPLPEIPVLDRRIPYSPLTKWTGLLRPASMYAQLLGDETRGPSFPAGKRSDSSGTPHHENRAGQANLSKETEERAPNRKKGPASRSLSLPVPCQSALSVQRLIGNSVKRDSLWINRGVRLPEGTPQVSIRQPSSSIQISAPPPPRLDRGTSGNHQTVEQIYIGSAPQRRTPAPARACHTKARSQYTEIRDVEPPRHIRIAFTQETIAHPDITESQGAMPSHQRH